MKIKNRVPILLAVMLILALIAGCQPSKAVSLLNGVYKRNDLALTFKDGSYQIQGGFGMIESGTYTTEGNTITFTNDNSLYPQMHQCDPKPTYTYKWTYDAETQHLIFEDTGNDTGDPCSTRRFDFTYKPLTYSEDK